MKTFNVYYDEEARLEIIQATKVAIIGYGSQARAHALNLKESWVEEIRIGLKKGSNSIQKAQNDGFSVVTNKEAAQWAGLTMVLVPDELQADIYEKNLKDNLQKGSSLVFAHGLNIHFKLIEPRKDLDVFMIAPKGPGNTVRGEYVKGGGVPCLVAIEKNPSGIALDIALSYASAIGGGKSGIIGTTFKEECETDLFGEQAVICGGVTALIKAGYETLVEAGYAPQMAYFECLHEMKLIVDLLYEGGIANMRYSISNTAEYGDVTRGPRVISYDVKKEMKKILIEIQDGTFVKEFMEEHKNGNKNFNKLRQKGEVHQIEEVGTQLREFMPWIAKNKLVDKKKN